MAPRQTGEGGGALKGSTAFFRAKEQALRFLAYRARSEAEVRRRLSRKYSQGVVEEVIEALRNQNLLDDLAFALQWRASREQFRPRAGGLIRQELQGFGVPAEVIEDSLTEFDEEANAARAAGSFARRLACRDADWSEFRGETDGPPAASGVCFVARGRNGGRSLGRTKDGPAVPPMRSRRTR